MVRDAFARLLAWLRADRATLPVAPPLLERVCKLVVLLASVWFALASSWELFAPFGAGHYAAATAVATGGENMLGSGLLGPVPHSPAHVPPAGDFYCHH